MDNEKRKISTTTDGKPPAAGLEDASAPQPINQSSGQHGAYWVLNEEERSKGFVRPVRRTYLHVGQTPPTNLRDLTAEEHERYDKFGYVKFEEYPPTESPKTGRFWTQSDLDRVRKGCGVATTMGQAIAETYARDPKYYGSTFCVGCKSHFPVEEFRWEDGSTLGS